MTKKTHPRYALLKLISTTDEELIIAQALTSSGRAETSSGVCWESVASSLIRVPKYLSVQIRSIADALLFANLSANYRIAEYQNHEVIGVYSVEQFLSRFSGNESDFEW